MPTRYACSLREGIPPSQSVTRPQSTIQLSLKVSLVLKVSLKSSDGISRADNVAGASGEFAAVVTGIGGFDADELSPAVGA